MATRLEWSECSGQKASYGRALGSTYLVPLYSGIVSHPNTKKNTRLDPITALWV